MIVLMVSYCECGSVLEVEHFEGQGVCEPIRPDETRCEECGAENEGNDWEPA